MRDLLLFMLAVISPAVAQSETLRGAVKDSSGAPIPDALVFIHWDSAGSTVGVKDNIRMKVDLSIRTKNDGTFTVDVAPGFYDVFASSPAFTPTCRKARIKPGAAGEITFRMKSDPLYTAEMGSRIQAVPAKR